MLYNMDEPWGRYAEINQSQWFQLNEVPRVVLRFHRSKVDGGFQGLWGGKNGELFNGVVLRLVVYSIYLILMDWQNFQGDKFYVMYFTIIFKKYLKINKIKNGSH